MRLIDAVALLKAIEMKWDYVNPIDFVEIVANAPTVQREERDKLVTELQATINDLREALEKTATKVITDGNPSTTYLYEDIHEALSKTPAQSLQAFENGVIEKCAKVCDEMDNEYGWGAVASATIRLLKG